MRTELSQCGAPSGVVSHNQANGGAGGSPRPMNRGLDRFKVAAMNFHGKLEY